MTLCRGAMDTLARHKAFLLTGVFLFLSSFFTARVDPPTEDIDPVESHLIKVVELVCKFVSFADTSVAKSLSFRSIQAPTSTPNPTMETISMPTSCDTTHSTGSESISNIVGETPNPHLDPRYAPTPIYEHFLLTETHPLVASSARS